MNERLAQVREMCEQRMADTTDNRVRIIEFSHDEDGDIQTKRFAGFAPNVQNEVYLDGELAMFSTDIPVRQALKIRKILSMSENVDVTRGVMFYLPPNAIVPCHRDEEAHKGYTRGSKMMTFNVSSPHAMLYVNNTGKEASVEFGVTGYFSTVLCPTQIYHGVINGEDPLYLLQFPLHTTPLLP
jgi:hypothetical protein